MMSDVYFGEIKDERLLTWNENEHPLDILVENIKIDCIGGWDFLAKANETFHDKVQVDWGSFAYKCKKCELIKVVNDLFPKLPWLEQQRRDIIQKIKELDDSALYGVVFIEAY